MRRVDSEIPADVFVQRAARRESARRVAWKFDLTPGQQEIAADPHRFRIVCNGRRWGKSFLASHEAVERANAAQGLVLLTAPTYKTARNGVWQHLISSLPPKYRRVHTGDMTIELTGGGRVAVGSLDQPDNLRGLGQGLKGIIVDEAAFVSDYAVESVLRPMLMDEGGWLLAISTPKGRRGWFYRYWLRGQSGQPEDEAYRSWQMPTWTNTALKHIEDEVEDLRTAMPEAVFQQEIAAQFVDDAGAVFRNVQLCATAERPELDGPLPRLKPGANYFVGIDFARSGADFTVITVLEEQDDGSLLLVWLDRWGRLSDEEQIDRLARVILHFRPRRVLAESNSFGAVYCAWMTSKYGITVELFTTSGTSKGPLVQQAAACFEFMRIEVWSEEDPLGRVLVTELLSYTRTTSTAGHDVFAAPEGYHDDCVISVCLAIRAAEGDPAGDGLAEGWRGPAETFMLRDGAGAPALDERWWRAL